MALGTEIVYARMILAPCRHTSTIAFMSYTFPQRKCHLCMGRRVDLFNVNRAVWRRRKDQSKSCNHSKTISIYRLSKYPEKKHTCMWNFMCGDWCTAHTHTYVYIMYYRHTNTQTELANIQPFVYIYSSHPLWWFTRTSNIHRHRHMAAQTAVFICMVDSVWMQHIVHSTRTYVDVDMLLHNPKMCIMRRLFLHVVYACSMLVSTWIVCSLFEYDENWAWFWVLFAAQFCEMHARCTYYMHSYVVGYASRPASQYILCETMHTHIYTYVTLKKIRAHTQSGKFVSEIANVSLFT